MNTLFIILALTALFMLLMGLINPEMSLFWSKTKTRAKVIQVYGTALIICFVLVGITHREL
jgi:hypothetical protein